ncbi:hypothetical protein ID866_9398 [Astraeus odoratus]|nr:hypothetical protein ID866_9398 [Astraeus odoratus]
MDVFPTLAKASQLASRYQIEVFDKIELDIQAARFNGYSLVYSGIDPFKGMRIAIKITRCGSEEQDEKIKVPSTCHSSQNIRSLTWMGKGTARKYVQDKSIDPRPILSDIANGIEYLHNHNPPIYHGDLNGNNVLISDDGRALLTGFHFSYMVASSFSMTGSIHGGSFNWMSPEALHDLSITPQRDVWAFGMTALELFTRAIPFPDIRHPSGVMIRILRGPLPERPSDESTCSRMSDAWWNICCSCWVHEKEKHPTISNIIDAIERSFVRAFSLRL